jgi:ubiquitin C-terminal hydrolase
MENKCNEKQILNPVSKRCVNKDGKIGKKILIANEKINIFWERNSCYIDSLLLSLFHNKDIEIENDFLKAPLNHYNRHFDKLGEDIRKELIKIYDIISNRKKDKINNCSLLRKLLNDYYKNFIKLYPNKQIIDINENYITSQLDIYDILNLFNVIFNFNNNLKFKEGLNYNNTNFFFNIPNDLLLKKKRVFIKKIIPSYKIKNDRLIIQTTLLKTNKLFLSIYRNLGTSKLETEIIPSRFIKLSQNPFNLYLTSIIIHYGNFAGGHYICLYKSNNKWYEYDDLRKSPVYIGSLNKIIKNDKYISNIVGLIYSK